LDQLDAAPIIFRIPHAGIKRRFSKHFLLYKVLGGQGMVCLKEAVPKIIWSQIAIIASKHFNQVVVSID